MKIIKRSLVVLLIIAFFTWLTAFVRVNYSQHEYSLVSAEQLAEAKAYLGNQLTPVPNDFEWQFIETDPGVKLRTGLLNHASPKGTVIVVPGFTGAIETMMREITQIHAAGYRVAAIEYRGQGLSYRPLPNHPEKGYVEDYALLANDLAKFTRQLKRINEPVFFFSISKGAHITMRMAAEHDLGIDGYALIVPMIQINSGGFSHEALARLSTAVTAVGLGAAYTPGASSWPGEKLVFGEATGCNANAKTAQTQSAVFAMNEKLRTKGVTYKWLSETTKSTKLLMNADYVKPITQPVKIYTAGIDELVRTDKANQFCGLLADCQTKHFAQSRHCITRENYALYDDIVHDAIQHFDAQL